MIDQATDIGVIIHFLLMWMNGVICRGLTIHPSYLCIASGVAFSGYRFISSILVFSRSNSCTKSIYQLFDFLILFGMKMNYKHDRNNLSKPQIWIHFLESLFNSFPQSLIQLYFIVQTGFSLNNTLIIISVIFSVISLTSSMMMQHNKEFNSSIFDAKIGAIFRFYDIFYRLSVLSLIWIILGGAAMFVVLLGELVVLSMASCGDSEFSLSTFISLVVWAL